MTAFGPPGPSKAVLRAQVGRQASFLKGYSVVADLGRPTMASYGDTQAGGGWVQGMLRKQIKAALDAADIIVGFPGWFGSTNTNNGPLLTPYYVTCGIGNVQDGDVFPATFGGGALTEGTVPAGGMLFTDPIGGSRIYAGTMFSLGVHVRVDSATGTGTTTSGSNSITSYAAVGGTGTATLAKGMYISGTGIPALTTVTAISGSTITISANATANGSAVALTSIGPWPTHSIPYDAAPDPTTCTVTTANGSPTLTAVAITKDPAGTGLHAGKTITGTGIPAATTITAVSADGLTVTMSANATASATVTAVASGLSDIFSGSATTVTDNSQGASLLTGFTFTNTRLPPGPAVILGRTKDVTRTLFAVVDSIGCGAFDNTPAVSTSTGVGMRRLGWIERTFGNDGVAVIGNGGMRANDVSRVNTGSTPRVPNAQRWFAGSTGVLAQVGTNDITDYPGTLTIAQVQKRILDLWRKSAGSRTIPGFAFTYLPRPASTTDSWATSGAQTLAAWEPARIAVNDWMRDGAPIDVTTWQAVAVGTVSSSVARCRYLNWTGTVWAWTGTADSRHPLALGGAVEVANSVETAQDSGLWKRQWEGTGTTTSGSPSITAVTTTAGTFATDLFGNGFIVVGTGIPANATGTLSGSTLTLSANATASASGVHLAIPLTNEGTHPFAAGYLTIKAWLDQVGSDGSSARSIIATAGTA